MSIAGAREQRSIAQDAQQMPRVGELIGDISNATLKLPESSGPICGRRSEDLWSILLSGASDRALPRMAYPD